MTKMKIAF